MTPTPTSALPDGRIAFIGLGNMGAPMAANLARAGGRLAVHDLAAAACAQAAAAGLAVAGSADEAVDGAALVFVFAAQRRYPIRLGQMRGRQNLVRRSASHQRPLAQQQQFVAESRRQGQIVQYHHQRRATVGVIAQQLHHS